MPASRPPYLKPEPVPPDPIPAEPLLTPNEARMKTAEPRRSKRLKFPDPGPLGVNSDHIATLSARQTSFHTSPSVSRRSAKRKSKSSAIIPKLKASFLNRPSTPPSYRMSSFGQHARRTRALIDKYLKRELKDTLGVPFEVFLKHVLLLSDEDYQKCVELFKPENIPPDVEKALHDWSMNSRPGIHESHRYEPFANLANAIIHHLISEDVLHNDDVSLTFCRNDPHTISTKSCAVFDTADNLESPERRPDVTCVHSPAVHLRMANYQASEDQLPDHAEPAVTPSPPSEPTGAEPTDWTEVGNKQSPEKHASKARYPLRSRTKAPSQPAPKSGPSLAPPARPRYETPRPIRLAAGFTLEWNEVLCCWEFKVEGRRARRVAMSFKRGRSGKVKQIKVLVPADDDDLDGWESEEEEKLQFTTPFEMTDTIRRDAEHGNIDTVAVLAVHEKDGQSKLLEGGLQLASYALEALSHRGLRRHVINVLVEGQDATVWLNDRGGGLVAEPFRVNHDFTKLCAVVFAMAKLTRYQWGFSHHIKIPHKWPKAWPDTLRGSEITVDMDGEPVDFILGTQLYGECALEGRGTTVVEAHSSHPKLLGLKLVVKFGWPVVSRQSETSMLSHARDKLLEDPKNQYLLNHLPRVYAHQDFEKLSEGIRAQLVAALGPMPTKRRFEDRVFRVIVMDRLYPITDLNHEKNFIRLFRDTLHCHDTMWTVCGVMHRDISLGNLMYREVKDDSGNVCRYGVINDWDLSVCPALLPDNTPPGPSSKHRSGTIPYCAITRLKPGSPHTLGQDTEAFFWSLLVAATCTIPKGQDVTIGPEYVIDWFECEPKMVRGLKTSFLSDIDPNSVHVTNGFQITRAVLLDWGAKLRAGHFSSARHPGGPHIKYKVIESFFRKHFGVYEPKTTLLRSLGYTIKQLKISQSF